MCGIAGFIGPWGEALLNSMLHRIRHRGPDGRGTWRDPSFPVALGHLRLSIIDLSSAASQPMLSPDGRYVISFNGEIYNYRELRRELAAAGVRFRTQSDTEVLLQLLIREKENCLHRIQGIFAFAFWDISRRRLLLARDQLGVKPLYYASLPAGTLFASELKALVACPDLPRDLDPNAVINHLGFLWSSSDATMLRAVRKLRPGHFAWVESSGRMTVQKYYEVPLPYISHEERASTNLTAILDKVVHDQMVADVPVGAMLSGGVDSSAIVASMCRFTDPSRLVAFCGTVEKQSGHTDNFGEDLKYSREVAAALGVPLIEVPTDSELVEELPDMLWQLDEPTADFSALQTQKIARQARQSGIKVVLSGAGGDDLFTGYGRHTAAYVWALADSLPGGRRIGSYLCTKIPSKSMWGRRLARFGQLLTMDEGDMLADAMSFSSWPAQQRLSLLTKTLKSGLTCRAAIESLDGVLERTRGLHPVDRMLQLDLDGFVPDLNLNYADKMAMREGVELRVPLLDPRIVQFAMGVPLPRKINLLQTKMIFREAIRDRLPASVLARKKQGFGIPVRAWLAGPGRPLLEELTSPTSLAKRGIFDAAAVAALRSAFHAKAGDVAFSLFTIMAVEIWCDRMDSNPPVGALEARQPAAVLQ